MRIEAAETNPYTALVHLANGADPRNPYVARVTANAMEQLGCCDDTMALLVQKLGLAGNSVPYKEIRSQFPHGREESSS